MSKENVKNSNANKINEVKRSLRKKSNGFKFFMWFYVALWIIVTVVICRILWTSLSGYQKGYDSAKEASNPDLAMDEALGIFSQDNVKNLVADMNIVSGSRFEDESDYVAFYENLFAGKELIYQRDKEMFMDTRPVYDVYFIGDYENKVAVVELKQLGEKDSYGFNKWTVKKTVISENYYEFHDVYVKVMDDMTVYINGQPVDEREFIREGSIENNLTDMTTELTGKQFAYKVYYAGDMIDAPEVKVIDADGSDVTDAYVMGENDLRDYTYTAPSWFVDEVSAQVQAFCENYVYHIYRKASYDSVAVSMEDGSEAKRLLRDAQSTLAWAWVPENVEILDEAYVDYTYYNENYFSVKSVINIRKSDSKTVEDEEFVCRWLFKKVNGQWLVTYFILG